MSADPRLAALMGDLTALGRGLPQPVIDPQLTDAVLARLPREPAGQRRSGFGLADRLRAAVQAARNPRRAALVVLVTVLLALFGTPAGRAAVSEWFSFAGVNVRLRPATRATTAPPPPAVSGPTTLSQARALVGFVPLVPAALGPPDGISVSADRRVLSMSWKVGGAPVRLDEFDGQLDVAFIKTATGVEYTTVNGSTALWFARPHDVVMTGADGRAWTETARLAGRTLIWQAGGTTLRLEGDLSRERALQIAASTHSPGSD